MKFYELLFLKNYRTPLAAPAPKNHPKTVKLFQKVWKCLALGFDKSPNSYFHFVFFLAHELTSLAS